MPTPIQIDEQVQLERDQIALGVQRLRDNTCNLEDKSYSSATIYGVTSIDALLPLLVKRIDDTTSRINLGQAGKSFKEIRKYLDDIEIVALAAIACKITFDKVFSHKEGQNSIPNVTGSIGRAIEDECQMRHYETNAPGLLKVLKDNYWHRSIGTNQKLVVIQTLMNRYDVQRWVTWGSAKRIKLGAWLLDCIMEVVPWFRKSRIAEGNNRNPNYLVPTPEFIQIKDQVMADSELFAPLAWPMLIPPNDWGLLGENPGGYLLNEVMRSHEMIRNGNRAIIQGKTPIKFLNQIQKVGYCLNSFTVSISEILQERGISVGKFIPIIEIPIPPKPVDIEENKEARKRYRRGRAEAENVNASSFRRSCRTRMTMEAVKRFKGREFYLPWSFDYRGRAYPIPSFLTPQDTDFGKSLIRFSNESEVTPEAKEWLSFQVATTYGLDKATMTERLEWTQSNIPLITTVAEDPIGYLSEWEAAEEPWQFAAACDEYYHCVIKQDRKTTGLPVATDATCSGLQILAGLARDKKTAQLVNVLPADRPQDAYKVVAEVAKWNCPEHIQKVMDRKIVKRTVMTIPYNAKPYSNRSYIRDALSEKGIEIDKDDLTVTVQAVRDAMHKVVPGPMSVMKWIEDEVSKALKRGVLELEWVTPSGFKVHQKIMKKGKPIRLKLQLLGNCCVHLEGEDLDEADSSRHKAATAPNLIHSLDGSLLHLSATRFEYPIALIHDSVLCRATDMSVLSSLVRETYMKLFAEQDYLTDFASQIGAETKPPIIGDLEPESVIESTYFFC